MGGSRFTGPKIGPRRVALFFTAKTGWGKTDEPRLHLTRIFHESFAATTDLAVLPGVLGCWPLRRTVQVRLGTNPCGCPGAQPSSRSRDIKS
jgi:hypothetical protein